MSLSDDLMWNWFDLLSMRSNEEIQQLKKECEAGRNPRDAKVMLAKEIVTRFHNAEAADAAEQEFINRFPRVPFLKTFLKSRSKTTAKRWASLSSSKKPVWHRLPLKQDATSRKAAFI